MSLAFGSGVEADLIGALSVPRSLTPKKRGGAAAAFWAHSIFSPRDLLDRATGSRRNRKSAFADRFSRGAAMCGEEKEIRDQFSRISDVAGLTNGERLALFGEGRELSRVILALETLRATLELFHESDAAVAWLRSENFAEPFNGQAPLRLMATNGRLGVEIALLYLRGRLRLAARGV